MSMSVDQRAQARQYLADPGTSAVQSIQIENATGGTFTISYDGQTTIALAWNAGANEVQNALCALSNIGVGGLNVTLSDGVLNSSNLISSYFTLYFGNTLGNQALPMVTVDTTLLTGAGALALVTLVTPGGIIAFSDAELDALYADAALNFFLAIAYGFRVLMSNAAKFDDYVAGQTQEKKAQIFSHLKDMEAMYQQWAFAGQQVQFTSLKGVPPRLTAVPQTSGAPATALQYAPPFGFGRGPWGWGRRGGWR